jgi:hypothetical protein
MPLPSPILDDRSYQQLHDELVHRIPVYTPEWTDHNASDPGITLIDLFAHLGEALLFRFNQIPETTKLAFLRLLDIPLRPAVPARAIVTLTTAKANGVEIFVPPGAAPVEARAGSIPFELQTEVHVLPVSGFGIAKISTNPPGEGEEEQQEAWLRAVRERGINGNEQPVAYQVVTLPEDPAAPTATAVDLSAAVDDTLWIPVLAATQTVTVNDLAGKVLNVGIIPDEQILAMTEVEACPGAGPQTPAIGVVWQLSSALRDGRNPLYRELVPVADTTYGLTRPGIVRLRLPKNVADFAPLHTADLINADLEGTDDLPPAIEDEDVAKKVLFWLRVYRPDGGPLPRMLWAGVNASEVRQQRTARPEYLGTGTAQPNQQYSLVNRQIVPRSLELQVEDADGWKPWAEVDGFEASGENDLHFVVDRDAGLVRFGNGTHGRAPQIGQRIRAKQYRYGGGRAGNVAAGAINKLIDVPDVKKIQNVLKARGGEDAEEIAAALERIPSEFRRHDRAVTESDFKELALMTPGADVGRSEVLPLFHPKHTDTDRDVPGVVTVVVWPREDSRRPDAPMPDRTLLSAVCRFLDARRLVTTELYVIPPTYKKIAVSVGVQVKPGYGVEAVRRWVELVLRQYLAPLPPYGPSGEGWPLGRRVHGPELESAALQVEGVEFLHGLKVAYQDDALVWQQTLDSAPTVTLKKWEVPQLAEITVVEGPKLVTPGDPVLPPPRRPKRPGDGAGGTTPTTPGTPGTPGGGPGGTTPPEEIVAVPVPIPIPRREC